MWKNKKHDLIEAVDLFCGAGGLSYGLMQAGISVKAGIDLDPACRYPFEANIDARFIQADISKLTGNDIAPLYSKSAIRLLAGCAPCQPFSTYSNGREIEKDDKWGLLKQFARIIEELKPDLVTMENVPRVILHQPYLQFEKKLNSLGYAITANIIRCQDIGVPQQRRRFVLLASKIGPITWKSQRQNSLLTVRDAIGHLPRLSAGKTDPHDPLHKARTLTDINLKRIKASRPGGSWREWPSKLRAPCHRREAGFSFKSVYSRMSWDAPSPTITTQAYNFGTGRFGHPSQDRAITLREAAILQSFPKNYKFASPKEAYTFSVIGRLIGNAVPPKLGEAIGMSIVDHVAEKSRNNKTTHP